MPDGIVDLPIDPLAGEPLAEIEERRDALEEHYPDIGALTEGAPATLEAETSTIEKPERTLANLRKAVNDGRTCLFTVPDGGDLAYWARRGENIVTIDGELTFVKEITDGDRHFYNKRAQLEGADGAVAVRPAPDDGGRTPSIEWVDTGDALVCRDATGGTVHARLDDIAALAEPPVKAFPAVREFDHSDESWIVRERGRAYRYGSRDELRADWRPIRAPFVPEREFDQLPTTDDIVFIVFPDADNVQYDQPQVYAAGECRPLGSADDTDEMMASDGECGFESDEAAFVDAVTTLAAEAIDGGDPDWGAVAISYADIPQQAG